ARSNQPGRSIVRGIGRPTSGCQPSETAMRTLVLAFLALPLAAAAAQSTNTTTTTRARRFMDNCQRNYWGDDERFCETRDVQMAASADLRVDGQDNGGITVHGWDKSTIQVVAMIQTNAESEADARDLAKRVRISANNGEVRSDGPDTHRHESWSVSYEIWVPAHTGLDLRARNGGIAVDGVESRMELETVNGGLVLSDVGGDVHGTTSNGGVSAELSGSKWSGAGLDLETGTVNGGMNIGFPITVKGSFGRRLSTQLGSGGPTIRAVTTNGGVTIRRR